MASAGINAGPVAAMTRVPACVAASVFSVAGGTVDAGSAGVEAPLPGLAGVNAASGVEAPLACLTGVAEANASFRSW